MPNEWERILLLKTWTELRALRAEPKEVLPGVYSVGPEACLQTQPFDSRYRRHQPGAPFVTLAYWASSLHALSRCTRLDPSVTVSALSVCPPACLLLGTSGKYGDLMRQMPAAEKGLAERAVYSNQGEFVHKVIESGCFRYCFLGGGSGDEAQVYCIELALL